MGRGMEVARSCKKKYPNKQQPFTYIVHTQGYFITFLLLHILKSLKEELALSGLIPPPLKVHHLL